MLRASDASSFEYGMAPVAPDVHQAACDNDVEELLATLENNPRLLEAETGSYRSKPLHWACIRGS